MRFFAGCLLTIALAVLGSIAGCWLGGVIGKRTGDYLFLEFVWLMFGAMIGPAVVMSWYVMTAPRSDKRDNV